MSTGQRIKDARRKADLTQKELGTKLGVAYQTVAQWENDLRKPKIETLTRIAEALGVDPYSLADWDTATRMIENDINSVDDSRQRITAAYEKLTGEGKAKAAEIVEIIAGNPQYQCKKSDKGK